MYAVPCTFSATYTFKSERILIMKVKKFLPQIITAVLSILCLVCAFLFSKVSVNNFPFRLYEKLGMYYHNEHANVIIKDVVSYNGTHETFITLLKKFAYQDVIILSIIPAILFALIVFGALVVISDAASKTQYKWTAFIASVLLPVVFLDFSNTSFFRTLYINPLILTLLLVISAVFLQIYKRNSVGIAGIVTVFVLTVIYSCLGNVQAVTAVILGVLISRLYKIAKNNTAKILAITLGCIVIIQSVAFAFNYKAYDRKQHLYNAVFHGIAQYDSVTEIGLDGKLDDFKGVYYGMKENEAEYDLENTFYSKISYADVIKYYVAHPVNAVKIINNQAKLSQFHEYDFGFAPYSTLKKAFSLNLLYAFVIAAVYVVISTIVGRKYNKLKPVTEFLSGIALMWFISLIATAVYCGNSDVARNMYTYNILFDIMFLSAIIGGLRVIIHRQEEKKKEFGITHE